MQISMHLFGRAGKAKPVLPLYIFLLCAIHDSSVQHIGQASSNSDVLTQ